MVPLTPIDFDDESHHNPIMSPSDAFRRLQAGHNRFKHSQIIASPTITKEELRKLAHRQRPFAVVVTCSDSRVPPELLFDLSFGDLFVIRVAGNILDGAEIGSIEYALRELDTPLVVILGHERCGAVMTAVKKYGEGTNVDTSPYMDDFLNNIHPAVLRAQMTGYEDQALIEETCRWNVIYAMKDLIQRSSIIQEKISKGKAKIIGGKIFLEDGHINWYEQDFNKTVSEDSKDRGH